MWWSALAGWQSFRHTNLTGAQGDCIEVEEIVIERRVNQAGLTPKKASGIIPEPFFCPGGAVRTTWRPGPWPA